MTSPRCSVFLSALFLAWASWACAAGLPELVWDAKECTSALRISPARQIARLEKVEGLRVFWWNIEGGVTNARITSGACAGYQSDHPLERNLVALAHSNLAPDVIALSEYDPAVLASWAEEELASVYPVRFFFPYSATAPGGGVGIFSKIPLIAHPREELAWAPGKTPEQKVANREHWLSSYPNAANFDRPYLRFEATWSGQRVNLVFEHLANPWPGIQESARAALPDWFRQMPLGGPSLASLWASARTGQELFFDEDSPLAVQTRELMSKLVRDFGPNLDREPLLLAGDLNAPSMSSVHRALTSKLQDAFGALTRMVPGFNATFPASCSASRGAFPPLKIDHGLLALMLSGAAEVLRINGADHYPLYLIAKPARGG